MPQLGSGITLNELDPRPAGGRDSLELYNPTPVPVNLAGWVLVNGTGIQPLNGFLPPNGFFVFVTNPGFNLDDIGLTYLFRQDLVRTDQLGFWDAPSLGHGECYARCRDGAPPYLGYSYTSSGGGATFLPLTCTLGTSNCNPAWVGEPPGQDRGASWGRIKSAYR